MNRAEFLKSITYRLSKGANKGKNLIIKTILEKVLETVSKVLIVPPIIFTGLMIVGMLVLLGMSMFTINLFPDFISMIDSRLIISTIGILISIIFSTILVIGWPIYIITLISGIWFIRTYRKMIKNNYLYIKANDFVDRV
ncbi:hypothetical protein [Paraclostridium bifermentans]|uniref:hypothetical protein n=1 Tax=Paraclostridium bifermentans TaxID=1490 RepID=UPI00359C392F